MAAADAVAPQLPTAAAVAGGTIIAGGAGRKALVLGYYDRGNLGDETFRVVLERLLPGCVVRNTDDVDSVPPDCTDVVVGGGDLVNPYFMERVARILHGFAGPRVAVSIGVPYPEHAGYLAMFDQVVVRSQGDLALAAPYVHPARLQCMPDLSTLLPEAGRVPAARDPGVAVVSLARPMVANNPHADDLVAGFVAIVAWLRAGPGAFREVRLLPFNVDSAQDEGDVSLCERVAAAVGDPAGVVVVAHTDPLDMLGEFERASLAVCTRFHSVMFALIARTPLVALHSTSKVAKLLADVSSAGGPAGSSNQAVHGVPLPTDAMLMPTSAEPDAAIAAVRAVLGAAAWPAGAMPADPAAEAWVPRTDAAALAAVFAAADDEAVGPEQRVSRWLPSALARVLELALRAMPAADPAALRAWVTGAGGGGAAGALAPDDLRTLARIACYVLSGGSVTSACAWGLEQQVTQPGFRPADALQYVYRHHTSGPGSAPPLMLAPPPAGSSSSTGAPPPPAVLRLAYYDPRELNGVHRSGWPFVMGGVVAQLAGGGGAGAAPSLPMLDTFVDRTFHWGRDALRATGLIPYRSPWVGIVHHTFDASDGASNGCVQLFQTAEFVDSLPSCRGLVALSQHLAGLLRAALDASGPAGAAVPVAALTHPTDLQPACTFDPARFAASGRLVQVGAWLRDPFAIYELPAAAPLAKLHLRGRNMASYFPPGGLDAALAQLADSASSAVPSAGAAALAAADGTAAAVRSACRAAVVRSAGGACRPAPVCGNQWVRGMLACLARMRASVQVLGPLSDADYDALLGESVVFLRLVDASAVNTVIECVARATPLLVNRLPAVEELLGAQYPGFYDDLPHAARLAADPAAVASIHAYMRAIDTRPLQLGTFVDGLRALVAAWCR